MLAPPGRVTCYTHSGNKTMYKCLHLWLYQRISLCSNVHCCNSHWRDITFKQHCLKWSICMNASQPRETRRAAEIRHGRQPRHHGAMTAVALRSAIRCTITETGSNQHRSPGEDYKHGDMHPATQAFVRQYAALGRRCFSSSPKVAAADVKKLGVIGAGQMVRISPLLSDWC